MLIKRVYEADPLVCPKCAGEMKVVAFIEPPQGEVIEKILKHCGLWQPSTPRPPPNINDTVYVPDDDCSAEAARYDGLRNSVFASDRQQSPSCDVPWEMAADDNVELFDPDF